MELGGRLKRRRNGTPSVVDFSVHRMNLTLSSAPSNISGNMWNANEFCWIGQNIHID